MSVNLHHFCLDASVRVLIGEVKDLDPRRELPVYFCDPFIGRQSPRLLVRSLLWFLFSRTFRCSCHGLHSGKKINTLNLKGSEKRNILQIYSVHYNCVYKSYLFCSQKNQINNNPQKFRNILLPCFLVLLNTKSLCF